MTGPGDPFDVLRDPGGPVSPDPAFADRLRARIQRAITLPRGATVSDLTRNVLTVPPSSRPAPTPLRPAPPVAQGAVVAYLAVDGAAQAIRFYGEAFGARLVGQPYENPDGTIGYAELDLGGGARLMLADQHPDIGFVAPTARSGSQVTLHLPVADVDGVVQAAVVAGAELSRPAADYEYGRNAVVIDPFGHRWLVSAEPARARADASVRHGDIGYASLWVPDVERAAAFFADVLGWVYGPSTGGTRQVVGQGLHHGLSGGHQRSTLFLAIAVADVDATVAAIAAAGGEAGAVEEAPYGRTAMCRDDQGVAFTVFEPAGGVSAEARDEPARHGDLVYVDCEVADDERARRFYQSALGWELEPARAGRGWRVAGAVPRIGFAGGSDPATIVPMYLVGDVAAAVERVRRAGGRATDPEERPYGWAAACADDQGTRFELLEGGGGR